MLSKIPRFTTIFLLLAALAWQTPIVAHADSLPSFSGEAFALRASVPATAVTPATTVTLADTGSLPSKGGDLQNSVLTATVPNLATAEVLHASTIGQGDRSRSEASVASLTVTAGGHTITADFLMTHAMAV